MTTCGLYLSSHLHLVDLIRSSSQELRGLVIEEAHLSATNKKNGQMDENW